MPLLAIFSLENLYTLNSFKKLSAGKIVEKLI